MYSSAFCSVGLQAYNLKSPNLSTKYIQSNNFKTSVSNVSFSLFNNEIYLSISLHSRRKSIVIYLRIVAITRSDKLRHSPAASDTESSSPVIAIIIRSLNNILFAF
jgi:hypothetical protein